MNNPFSPLKRVFAGAVMMLLAVMAGAQTLSPLDLPLYFQASQDQTKFLSSGMGYQFVISPANVQMTLRESSSRAATARMEFFGANARARIGGAGELPGKVNYLIGNDPSKWQMGLPTFGQVQVSDIYPGINLIYHGNQQQLEYDFAIAPGANPNAIKIHFDGVDKIFIGPQGELVLKIRGSEIRQPLPEIYQMAGGAQKRIGGGYTILDSRTVGFEVGGYDSSVPLVIDPLLGYSAFFGGNVGDTGWAIARGTNDGCIYIAGQTASKGFSTLGALQTTNSGGKYVGDAFVAKFGNPATNLIYLTYLGGTGDDAAYGLTVDSTGHAFVTGATESTNFPVLKAIPGQANIGGKPGAEGIYSADAFVAELGPGGSNLVYSTHLGGEATDWANAIALDSSGNAYVTGVTYSTNFPVTTNALLKHLVCTNNIYYCANAFVSEITNGGGALVYSTYLGGTNYDMGKGIAVDWNDNVYVAGYTRSFNFPVWNTPANMPALHYLNGDVNRVHVNVDNAFDGFVTKFPPLNGTISPSAQTNAFYSTFLGGTNDDMAYAIAVDGAGNAYVTGWTSSTNFPNTNNPAGLYSFVTTNRFTYPPQATNAFLTKISPDGSNVLNSAVFGGRRIDIGYGVAVDAAGDAFVVGAETSTNFPTMNTYGSLRATNSWMGHNDAFVTGFMPDFTNNYYSVLMGGKRDTFGYGIVLDASTNVWITGSTDSTNFPTQNASRFWFKGTNFINGTNYIDGAHLGGTNDAFLAEIILAPVPPLLAIQPTNQTVGAGATVNFSVTVTGATGPVTYQWQTNGVNLANGATFSGVTTNILTITNAQLVDSGTNYGVVVTYGGGLSEGVSNAVLTVSPYPLIIIPPTNQTVGVGDTVTFTVIASGAPLVYAWSTNGGATHLANGGRISGATNNVLTISDAQTSDAGTYTVSVSDLGNTTNASATLKVLAGPLFMVPSDGDAGSHGLVLSGVGGTNGGTYFVLMSTNLLTPLNLWAPIATNQFDSHGQFTFTNPLQTNLPASFYILKEK